MTAAEWDTLPLAVWSVILTDEEFSLLREGVSPLYIRPDALVFYRPLIAREGFKIPCQMAPQSKCEHIIGFVEAHYEDSSALLAYDLDERLESKWTIDELDVVFTFCPLCGQLNSHVERDDEGNRKYIVRPDHYDEPPP